MELLTKNIYRMKMLNIQSPTVTEF